MMLSLIHISKSERGTIVSIWNTAHNIGGMMPGAMAVSYTHLYGAVFLIGIGGKLSDGKPHDGRAPDYDDWTTESENGYKGLNGDILVWNAELGKAFELSSMGIRVDESALRLQVGLTGDEERLKMDWHQDLLNGKLPLSIGGGIGQSRLAMLLLHKKHIGEVQSSVWPKEMLEQYQHIL